MPGRRPDVSGFARFRCSRKTKIERDRLLEFSGVSGTALDRLAVALSLAEHRESPEPAPQVWTSMETEDGSLHEVETLDDFEGQAVFSAVLEFLEGEPLSTHLMTERLRFHVNRGYDLLYRAFEEAGTWPNTLAMLAPPAKTEGSSETSSAQALEIEIGRRPGTRSPVFWVLNREGGSQTNANARLVGMPGVGKSQVLLNLLASVAQKAPEMGFILFDYKGDLHTNSAFLQATGAVVHHPGEKPIPINPFQLYPGINVNLAPRAFVEILSQLDSKIGAVQKKLITDGMRRAYQGAARLRGYPTLSEIVVCIEQVYAEAERKTDTVLAILQDLTGYACFAEESGQSQKELLGCRWVINLAGLPTLREFVASVLLQFLHQAIRTLPDTTFDHESQVRSLRSIVAIDEAHYYIKARCQPLLDLVRTSRSKGVPIFLSSQSLEDFGKFTELDEFLPNTFCFKHGKPPDRKRLAGSLGLGTSEAEQATSAVLLLEKFSAYATMARDLDHGVLEPIDLLGFWERNSGKI